MIAPSNDPRWERLRKAVALEPVDKVPVCLEGVAWCARVVGMTLEEFLSDANISTQAEIDSFKLVGNADCVNNPSFSSSALNFIWMTGVKRPGFEVGPDEPWQVEESGLMTHEDYDAILEMGWPAFQAQFLNERIRPGLLEEFVGYLQKGPSVIEQCTAADMPYLSMAIVMQPFESLCGGRTFTQFVLDLYRTPDKVEEVMQSMFVGPQRRRHRRLRRHGRPRRMDRRLAFGQQDARAAALGPLRVALRQGVRGTGGRGRPHPHPALRLRLDARPAAAARTAGRQVHPLARQHDRHP